MVVMLVVVMVVMCARTRTSHLQVSSVWSSNGSHVSSSNGSHDESHLQAAHLDLAYPGSMWRRCRMNTKYYLIQNTTHLQAAHLDLAYPGGGSPVTRGSPCNCNSSVDSVSRRRPSSWKSRSTPCRVLAEVSVTL